jgi:penicillin-binding protein 2
VTSWRDPATGENGTAWDAFNKSDVGAAFDLAQWPIAAKTGTAQVNGKADTALFAAFGPSVVPSNPATANNVAQYSMVVVLEQSGFGGRNAAPVAAKVLDAAFKNTVPHAMSTVESVACVNLRDAGANGTTPATTTSTTTRPGAKASTTSTTTTKPPARQQYVLDTGVVCP